tara:strand:+ start:6894 stop:7601 length:708 start_codon:yes stop_codon:yes gene_type:complete
MKLEKERLLVISPHADDEVLGCYGLIKKIKDNGGEVFVQILSLGGYKKIEGNQITTEEWQKELAQVSKILELDDFDVAYTNNEIQHIDTKPQQELIEYIENKSKISISKIKPTIVAIPTIFSTHQDHTFAYKVAIAALRPHPQKATHMPQLVISYESPEYYFWSAYSEFGRFQPNFYLNLSQDDLNKKSEILNLYSTQMRAGQRGGENLSSLARIRGNEIGLEYAEAFHIHRLFT